MNATTSLAAQVTTMMTAESSYNASQPSPATYQVVAKRRFAVTLSHHTTIEAAKEAITEAATEWADAPTLLYIYSGAYGAEAHLPVGGLA